MKIKALRHTVASGVTLQAGKTYDVSDADGRYLVRLGKAEEVAEKKPASKASAQAPAPVPAQASAEQPAADDLLTPPEQ